MIEEILAELERLRGYFPREAIQKAVEHREEITPALLHIIEDTTERAEELRTDYEYMAHMYAMYLLAQFREPLAYRPIEKFFRLSEDVTDDLTGDLAATDLPRILASVWGGHDVPLKRLVLDEKAEPYVRAAALKALVVLLASGQKSRAEIVAYFRSLFHGGLPRTVSFVWDMLVDLCLDIHPAEFREEIAACFEEDLMEGDLVYPEDVEDALAEDRTRYLERLKEKEYYTLIDDAGAAMDYWPCFMPEPDYSEPSPASQKEVKKMIEAREKELHQELLLLDKLMSGPESEPTYRPYVPKPKIGRNEPCPCGSGKKYKKCCGNPALQDRQEP